MKNLLLIFCLLPAIVFGGELKPEVIIYGNLEIHAFNERRVQIYTDGQHKFGIDCSERMMCNAFVTHSMDSVYTLSDGMVVANQEVLPLSARNIRYVIESHNEALVFVLSTAGASGRNSTTQKFLILDDGSFYQTIITHNWMQYGHPDDYPL